MILTPQTTLLTRQKREIGARESILFISKRRAEKRDALSLNLRSRNLKHRMRWMRSFFALCGPLISNEEPPPRGINTPWRGM
jgi:hypothetical protein